MRLSIARSRESLWVWLFWGLGFYLVLEIGPFLIAGLVLKEPARSLVGPYLAFATPAMIFLPLVWWLRKWEGEDTSPRRLARRWGLSMALFAVAVEAALFYSGVEFRLMDPKDAVGGFVVVAFLSLPIAYFGMYRTALRHLSVRTAKQPGGPHHE